MSEGQCNLKISKADFLFRDEVNYTNSQLVLISKSHLHQLPNYKKQLEDKYTSLDRDWYPYCNSYYQYTEDVDAFSRVNHLLANKPSIVSLNLSEEVNLDTSGSYREQDIQNNFLNSNPLNFIILGKPGIGEEDLGKKLADYWKCVYIDPRVLVEEEIENFTRIGQCIEFNLRCGRAIGIDIILRLLEKRIKTQSCLHRGYVLCGLPVIPNDLYKEDPISSETAVFTARDIFEELIDVTVEIGVPPQKRHVSISSKVKIDVAEGEEDEEDIRKGGEEQVGEEETAEPNKIHIEPEPRTPPDLGSISHSICNEAEISTDYDAQLNFIFSLLQPPYMIVYLKCPTTDVINKRENYRFDIYSGRIVDIQKENTIKAIFTKLHNGEISNEEIPMHILDAINFDVEDIPINHLVTLPSDFACHVSNQLDKYHYIAASVIERRVLLHDPQYFLKLDARFLPTSMFHALKTRLSILPFQKPLIPKKMDPFGDLALLGEEAETDLGNTNVDADMSPEQCFKILQNMNLPSNLFKWSLSSIGVLCPVSMYHGEFINGNAKHAVQFLNKIYFLNDEESFRSFVKNPRPYLSWQTPKNRCRIFICGPKYSGKTEIAYCLHYLLNGTMLSEKNMKKVYLTSQYNDFKEKIRQAALLEGVQILNEKRSKYLAEVNARRETELNNWVQSVTEVLNKYYTIQEKIIRLKEEMSLSPFPMKMDENVEDKYAEDLYWLKEELQKYLIPNTETLDFYKNLLDDYNELIKFCPDKIKNPVTKPPADVTHPFVINYAEQRMKNLTFDAVPLGPADLCGMYLISLRAAEERYEALGNHKGGWIVDGMSTDIKLLEKIFKEYRPDDFIILNPLKYMDFEKFKQKHNSMFNDYRNLFLRMNKIDTAWKCPETISDTSLQKYVILDIVEELIDNATGDGEASIEDKYVEYKQAINQFREKVNALTEFCQSENIVPLIVDTSIKPIEDTLMDIVEMIDNKIQEMATPFTEEDRAEEIKYFGELNVEDETAEGGAPNISTDDLLELNRRYGDTSYYCPVTYKEKSVLWRGKEDYAVKYQSKVYLMATQEDMNKFILKPWRYTLHSPPAIDPPLRICIVGLDSTLNSTICGSVVSNMTVVPISFEMKLRAALNLDSTSFGQIRRNHNLSNTPLYQYLNNRGTMDEVLTIAKQTWHEFPYNECGFVIQDFPKRSSDIQLMIENKLIPDIIIHITGDEFKLKSKVNSAVGDKFKQEYEIKQKKNIETNQYRMEYWKTIRKARFDELLEEKRALRYTTQMDEDDQKSQVSYNSVADQEDVDEINEILKHELPEPTLLTLPESWEENFANLEEVTNEDFSVEWEMLQEIRELSAIENIPWKDIDINFDDNQKTKYAVLRELNKLKERRGNIFERCYDISLEVADKLLSVGYYFFSKFGKTCPVQYYYQNNQVQMYIPSQLKGELYPVIYRSHVYFICGRQELISFKEHPLKYINVEFKFPLIPYRIAVIGPPKCGKTSLTRRFIEMFGLKHITRGKAIRHVLKYLPHSTLAMDIESVLRNGWELTVEMVIKAVEAMSYDGNALTQGIVFDGFPNIMNELRHMYYIGLLPHLILDLDAPDEKVFECLKSDGGFRFPMYSERFITHMLDEWKVYENQYRIWLDKKLQILAKLGTHNKWHLWREAYKLFTAVSFEIKHYYIHVKDDWALRLGNMAVTPLEFLERQSNYKEFCPGCLSENKLKSGGTPPDRTGLIQYKKHFYWVCPNHIEAFLKCPECYFSPYNIYSLPSDLPKQITLDQEPENVYNNGYCVTCVKRHPGLIEFAVLYREQIYLFDSINCLNNFMKEPLEFAFKTTEDHRQMVSLEYRDLPCLGMFEQYLGQPLMQAVCHVNKMRPVIPGLSIAASAAICMGVCLKLNNDSSVSSAPCSDEIRAGCKLFYERFKKFKHHSNTLKNIVNPYIYYQETIPKFGILDAITDVPVEVSSSTRFVTTILQNLFSGIIFDKAEKEDCF